MDINNIKYIIFDYSEVNKIDFNEVLETSIETLRITEDATKTIVKWIGDEPSCISNLTSKSIIYNNDEMLVILDSPEWAWNNPYSGTTD